MGSGYRVLWTTPIRVEIADLTRLGGGLTPFRVGGGTTTRTLHLRGEDGRRYVMRSVDKSPQALEEELRGTPVERILQDQISSFHPSGALVVAPLLEAVGVLHTDPRLVVIPDDPRLGEFREEFAGMLVLFEERPDDGPDGSTGFAGSVRIVGSDRLFELLEDDPRNAVEAEEFLKSRLVDLMVGDRDRSKNNHLWARFDDPSGRRRWRPIPRDRDQAFVEFDGIIKALGRQRDPRLVTFGPRYPDIVGLSRNAWDLDRNLLVSLDRETWRTVASQVSERLTDEIVRAAVRHLPPEHYAIVGSRLEAELLERRDRLPEIADELYGIVFKYADVHATDVDEVASIEGLGDEGVRVTIRRAPEEGRVAHFSRVFRAGETEEVRLYLHGGDDRAVVEGVRNAVKVRVIGGQGRDRLEDASNGSRKLNVFYDGGDNTEFIAGDGAKVVRRTPDRPFSWWDGSRTLDWGGSSTLEPGIGFDSDRGLVLSFGVKHDRYAFDKNPYASRIGWRVGWAFGAAQPELSYRHDVRHVQGAANLRLVGRWSGLEIIDFFGFGNESRAPGSSGFYEVDQRLLTLRAALEVGDGEQWSVDFGPVLRHASSDTADVSTFIAQERPYGSGSFGQLGVQSSFVVDGRDRPTNPAAGYRLSGGGRIFPGVLDLESGAFGALHAEAAGYVSPRGGNPTLAARVGGKKVWGTFPFYEAAFVGGTETVRGLRELRYAGDAALFANAELRVRLGSTVLILPTDIGVFGLADVGRVYLDGESSEKWHSGLGAGVSFTPLLLSTTIRFFWARSEGRDAYYLDMAQVF